MGTPDFAVPSLKALHTSGHTIALVVTRPDRPKGRGRKVFPPPIKTQALNLGLDTIQPKSLRTQEFEDHVLSLKPDFLIVVAFLFVAVLIYTNRIAGPISNLNRQLIKLAKPDLSVRVRFRGGDEFRMISRE